MNRIEEPGHAPLHVWAPDLPDGALRQLRTVAAEPYLVGPVAAMPDAHVAEGVSVGTVFATRDVLVPAVLGGDLGCGMSALHLGVPAAALSREELQEVLRELTRRLSGRKRETGETAEQAVFQEPLSTHSLEHERSRTGVAQLGTVGGGNHFLEFDRDMEGALWVLVHSGSRAIGGAIAAHHGKVARPGDGAVLPHLEATSEAGRAFLHDLDWGLRYARENRRAVLATTMTVLEARLGHLERIEELDAPHNFLARELHGGEEVWVHRKGAAAAAVGKRLLVPGSMGTASYVVEGLGCAASFGSCSHGAGRVMSRREARDQVRVGELERAMRRVVWDERLARSLVEEAPAVYRDIREVLAAQEDLIVPRVRLEPVAVFKGT